MRLLLAPKSIFPSVALRQQGMGIARAESARLISTRNGNRCTWITQTDCKEPRLIGRSRHSLLVIRRRCCHAQNRRYLREGDSAYYRISDDCFTMSRPCRIASPKVYDVGC